MASGYVPFESFIEKNEESKKICLNIQNVHSFCATVANGLDEHELLSAITDLNQRIIKDNQIELFIGFFGIFFIPAETLCTFFAKPFSLCIAIIGKHRNYTTGYSRKPLAVEILLQLSPEQYLRSFESLKTYIRVLCAEYTVNRAAIIEALYVNEIYYMSNEIRLVCNFKHFYIPELSHCFDANMKNEFIRWASREISLLNFPFFLAPEKKAKILKIESTIRMRHELQDSFFKALFEGVQNPFLFVEVRQDHLLADALLQLDSRPKSDFRKQLKIKFINEEGIDEGGLQKEFFQLLIRELLHPKFGIFIEKTESNHHWLPYWATVCIDQLTEYVFAGKLIGLALYNSIMLDLHFPTVFYKKLLGRPISLIDVQEFDPILYNSLQFILKCSEAEFEALNLEDFSCAVDSYDGSKVVLRLKEKENLCYKNRHEVMFCSSIQSQFDAFKSGFDFACGESCLNLFRPEELQVLIGGDCCFDFHQLQEITQYDGGFMAESPIIRQLWEILHTYSEDNKKKFLAFTTGSDRVPVGGFKNISFTISRNGPDSDKLPTAHTCFNVLLLNEYSSKEKLERLLTIAIQNFEGFGLI